MLRVESLRQARWFGSKSRTICGTREVDHAHWTHDDVVSLVEVTYTDGPPEIYVIPERFETPAVARNVLRQFDGASVKTERGGSLVFRPTHVLLSVERARMEPVAAMKGEQSNTSIRFGDALILKLFRRLQYGPNPDVEIGWFLTEETSFEGTPPVAGSLTYIAPDGQEASLALLQAFEPNRGDAWTTTLARLRSVLDGGDMADSLAAIGRLAKTTAELHVALASGSGDFAAEPISSDDVEVWLATTREELRITCEALARRDIPIDIGAVRERADGLRQLVGALKTRHHGDYHLGQVLERDDGAFVIIDFEGEPSRPLAQRREKRSPLRDVAGLLRSLDYARNAAVRSDGHGADAGDAWYHAARGAFLDAYLPIAGRHPRLLPEDIAAPLAALELEKAAYEVLYELNNRPDWLPIPLAAFTSPSA